LNQELFGSLAEARLILEQWQIDYNEERPHSALGYLTHKEFAAHQYITNLRWSESQWSLFYCRTSILLSTQARMPDFLAAANDPTSSPEILPAANPCSQGQGDSSLAFIRGPTASGSAPTPPNDIFRRADLIQTIGSNLQSVDLLLLIGSTGIGKSTLAACVAQTWERIFWVSLRRNAPESISVGLRRLTAAISTNQGQSLIVLDDIDLTPAAIREFESQFASLLIVAKDKASPVLLTSQRESLQIGRLFSDYAQSSIRVPSMSLDEIRAYCVQQGCQEPDSV
jgi:Integrase core domain/ATPase family associated with various cellular activities (AAA)